MRTAASLIRHAKTFEEDLAALETRLAEAEGVERIRARLAHARELAEDVRAILEQVSRDPAWPIAETP